VRQSYSKLGVGRFLRHGVYTFLGALARWTINSASNSCILLYLHRYCTAFRQWASAKLCSFEQRAPPIFGRGRASCWALAHFLVSLYY